MRLFRVSIPASVLLLILLDAAILLSCYIVAALFALNDSLDPEFYLLYDQGLIRVLIAVGAAQIGMYLADLYQSIMVRSHTEMLQKFAMILGGSFLLQATLGYGQSSLQLPKWTMVYGSVGVLVLLPLWRFIYDGIVRNALPRERFLFVLPSALSIEIMREINRRPELGYHTVGYIDTGLHPAVPPVVPYFGTLDRIQALVREKRPDRIVIGRTDAPEVPPIQDLLEWRFSGLRIEEAATAYETIFGRISIREWTRSNLIFTSHFDPKPASAHLQTIYSFLLASIGAVVTSPVMVVVAVLVKLSSPGPILLRQTRVGLRGAHFTLYKFRSMYTDAEANTGAVWATENDPRITPVGRWLRQLRLDELPQFFNVICGEMAVVGPRPERPEFSLVLEEETPFYRQRQCVKPGITGWAQINHKYGDTTEDAIIKLEYDLYYIKNLAPALDAYIIFHTLKVMLISRGAQ